MTAETVTRWARRLALAGVAFLVAWQVGVLVGIPRRAEVVLALYGFVFHTLFGKAYSLVPTYFDRQLAWPAAPALQFPLSVAGTLGLLASALDAGPAWLGAVGALLWALGVATFLATIGWTIRDNLTGAETATGEAKAAYRPVDRLANAFVPVALAFLLVGTYETLALAANRARRVGDAALPALVGSDVLPTLLGSAPRASHALAAGTAGLMVLALGARLFPRFLGATLPRWLVAPTLAAGTLGPALLATRLWIVPWFRLGAVLQALALVGFAVVCVLLAARAKRRRVGVYALLGSAAFGLVGVALGLATAFGHPLPDFALAHLRTNLLGFLGLAIVAVTYQFYPPAAGRGPGASDRTALAAVALLAAGLLSQVLGLVAVVDALALVGRWLATAGAMLHAYLVAITVGAR